MTRLLLFLTGLALLGQVDHATAQTGAVKNKGLAEFFSSVFRSSSPVVSDGHPKTTDVKGGERNLLLHDDLLKVSCEKILKEGLRITSLFDRMNDRSGKMKLQLRGIYTRGPALYFLLRMHNRSALDYDVEAVRFYIASPQNRKTPLVRCGEVKPVYVYDSSSVVRGSMVRGYSQVTNVIVLPRFTLPYGKRLLIEVLEKNGGRHLQLLTTNFMLERAHLL
jgi:hypothetical protein